MFNCDSFCILIETERDYQRGGYLLRHNISKGNVHWYETEKEYAIDGKDRLLAAIINCGYACRFIADNDAKFSVVRILTDTDGKDCRYDNEHNVLYSLLNPYSDVIATKYAGIYKDYQKYLERIRRLRCDWNIIIELTDGKSAIQKDYEVEAAEAEAIKQY